MNKHSRTVIRVAKMWENCVLLELSEELKKVPLQQRPVALAVIHERCVYYAQKKVSWYMGKPEVRERLAELEEKHLEQTLLAEFLNNEKYIRLVIDLVNKLLPRWLAGENATYLARDKSKQNRDIYNRS
jgi:hypothetical protein